MSVLRNWYCGEKFPFEEIVSQDPDYRKITTKLGDEMQYFKDHVDEKERFEQMEELLHRSNAMEEYANFSYGFRLGALLMCEVFNDYLRDQEI